MPMPTMANLLAASPSTATVGRSPRNGAPLEVNTISPGTTLAIQPHDGFFRPKRSVNTRRTSTLRAATPTRTSRTLVFVFQAVVLLLLCLCVACLGTGAPAASGAPALSLSLALRIKKTKTKTSGGLGSLSGVAQQMRTVGSVTGSSTRSTGAAAVPVARLLLRKRPEQVLRTATATPTATATTTATATVPHGTQNNNVSPLESTFLGSKNMDSKGETLLFRVPCTASAACRDPALAAASAFFFFFFFLRYYRSRCGETPTNF